MSDDIIAKKYVQRSETTSVATITLTRKTTENVFAVALLLSQAVSPTRRHCCLCMRQCFTVVTNAHSTRRPAHWNVVISQPQIMYVWLTDFDIIYVRACQQTNSYERQLRVENAPTCDLYTVRIAVGTCDTFHGRHRFRRPFAFS